MADSQTMKIIIKAVDDSKKALHQINEDLQKINKSTKTANTSFGILKAGIAKFSAALSNARRQLFTLKNAVIGAVAAFGAFKIYSYIKGSTLLAARYKTLGVTVRTLGKQAGYTVEDLEKYEKGLEKTGIAAIQTRSIIAKMIQSSLDLSKATDLGRVAQNAAVIAGLNSSETFERMIHAIQANSVEILRTIGMNVSFEKSYKVLAQQLDINVNQLTEAQKTQARFNAVLQGGVQIAGAYGAAMTTAGKKMLSFSRYVSNFRLAVGKAFEPTLAIIVDAATNAMKAFTKSIKDEKFQQELEDFAQVLGVEIKKAFTWLIDNKTLIIDVIKLIIESMGNAIKSLTYLLDLLITSQDDLINQQRRNLKTLTDSLAKFVAEREVLKEKLLRQEAAISKGFFGTKTEEERNEYWLARLDFGKAKRRVNELDALIAKYMKLAKELDAEIKKSEAPREKKKVVYPTESVFMQFQTFLKPTKNKDPLGSNLMASAFKRSAADIKLELDKLSSDYDQHLITLSQYYNKRAALAKESFENEKKFIQTQIEREPDADKKLKLQDRIYALEKTYQSKIIKLLDNRRKAEKELADERLSIERTLQEARLALLEGGSQVDVNRAELEQLKISQEERLRSLKESRADRDQLKEAEIISNRERLRLIEKQEKDSIERRKQIQRTLTDAKRVLVDPQNYSEVFRIELEQLEEQQADRLSAIKAAKMKEQEEMAAIEDHYRTSQLEKEKLLLDQKLKIQKALVSGTQGILGDLGNAFGDMYEASGRKMKAWAKAQKAIAVAQTVIATYQSAVEAFKSLSGIPIVGPALGYAAAAAAIAAGLAKVAVIKSQSFASGGEVKGYSPTKTSDNISINATAGEYMQPVDTVKYYTKKGMEAIRQKIIPREVIAHYARNVQIPMTIPRYSYAEGGSVGVGTSGGIATNINVTMTGGSGDSAEQGREVGRAIKNEFNKNLKEQMRPGGLLHGV